MNNEKLLPRLVLLSSLIALLVMSFLFDLISSLLEIQSIQGAGYQSVLVVLLPIFQLVLVFAGMGLFRYLNNSPDNNNLVSWIFVVVGLLFVFFEALLFFLPVPLSIYSISQLAAPGTYLFLGGSLVCIAGMLNLILKRSPRDTELVETETVVN
ncbi:MAG: hypothetical protein A2W35_09720 [Chloroflexi bacterium RBG_16_57_11]|nr:MAG: hypothetical protein A2W35_09720 [Chloroflexi bacterium RBG_16_57_11]